MKILYASVHSVLEYDEIRLFKSLGHDVFPLGANYGLKRFEPLREEIVFNETEHDLHAQFLAMGGSFQYSADPSRLTELPEAFVALFDVVVVMHSLPFIERFWPILHGRPVIWRTIGQGIEGLEPQAAVLKAKGMHIVRYSPVERLSPHYCGETALIRFGKDPAEFGPWTGGEPVVLNFTNTIRQRFPEEAANYRASVEGLESRLGGIGNDDEPDWIGLVSPEEQTDRFNRSRAYYYGSGRTIPYTLNLIEAMLTGIPVVCFDQQPRSPYFEVPNLLEGGAGLIVGDVENARSTLSWLLDDHQAAADQGRRGRERAIKLFGHDSIAPAWDRVFRQVTGAS